MQEELFKLLIKLHPDELINVRILYFPRLKNIPPWYDASVYINGELRYTAERPNSPLEVAELGTPDAAIARLLSVLK